MRTAPTAPTAKPCVDFAALKSLIASRGLKFAEFWFTDLAGRPWRITMPVDALTPELFEQGLPLDGQPVGGSWDGVMILQPRYDALYPDPTASAPTLAMFCDVLDPATREPLTLEPRHVLAEASQRAETRLGARLVLGAEPEFLLLEGDGKPAAESVVWDFLRGLALALGEAGVQIDWFRTGPAAGQGRVQMRAGAPLQLADRVILYRHLAANLSRARGLSAVFLPRPLAGEGIPGMPVHLALWSHDGRNLFHDESGWALTSQICRSWAGGILAHLPSLLAFCAPTTNSYRRLIPGVCGPTASILSAVDRSAACRIPARSGAPAARRVKFCSPDSTANPYLAFAAIIQAGVDGVERALEAPLDGSAAEGGGFPHTLESALDSLDSDREFLAKSGVFCDDLIAAWITDRWERQVLPVRSRPHPWELSELESFGRARGLETAAK
jgi:glutamine synthetase